MILRIFKNINLHISLIFSNFVSLKTGVRIGCMHDMNACFQRFPEYVGRRRRSYSAVVLSRHCPTWRQMAGRGLCEESGRPLIMRRQYDSVINVRSIRY